MTASPNYECHAWPGPSIKLHCPRETTLCTNHLVYLLLEAKGHVRVYVRS